MKKLNAAGYYGGIGSGLLGLQQAGLEVIANYEPREIYDTGTFHKNFPGVPYYNSLAHPQVLMKHGSGHIDVLLGQPPCKRFSNLAMKNKTRHIFIASETEYYRFFTSVLTIAPKFFIVENLPSITKFFTTVKQSLLYKGQNLLPLPIYFMKSYILNALDFGIPQNRKRLFVIGSLYEDFEYDPKKSFHHSIPSCLVALDDIPAGVPNQDIPRHSETRKKRFAELKYGESYYGTQNNRKLDPMKPAYTITSSKTHHIHYSEPRVLTVRERARLMGFPDSFEFVGPLTKQFDQTGCSIVPSIAHDIGIQIREFYEQQRKESNG